MSRLPKRDAACTVNRKPRKEDALAFASADVAAELRQWLSYLGGERRMSAKTLEAYRRDVQQFLMFLAEHLGDAPSLKQLSRIEP